MTLNYILSGSLAIGDAAMDPIDFPIAPVDAMIKVFILFTTFYLFLFSPNLFAIQHRFVLIGILGL